MVRFSRYGLGRGYCKRRLGLTFMTDLYPLRTLCTRLAPITLALVARSTNPTGPCLETGFVFGGGEQMGSPTAAEGACPVRLARAAWYNVTVEMRMYEATISVNGTRLVRTPTFTPPFPEIGILANNRLQNIVHFKNAVVTQRPRELSYGTRAYARTCTHAHARTN